MSPLLSCSHKSYEERKENSNIRCFLFDVQLGILEFLIPFYPGSMLVCILFGRRQYKPAKCVSASLFLSPFLTSVIESGTNNMIS